LSASHAVFAPDAAIVSWVMSEPGVGGGAYAPPDVAPAQAADTNGVASDTVRRSSRSMERASIGLACYDPNRYETPALQPTSICAALKLVKVGLVISVRE